MKLFVYALLSLCLTSCFEIVEDISINKNGSGNFKIILNLSQSKSELNTLMKLDSSAGYNIPTYTELNQYLDKTAEKLKMTKGLSNVVLHRNFKNWVFDVSATFSSLESMHDGFTNVQSEFSGAETILFKSFWQFNGKNFTRETQNPEEKLKKNLNRPTERNILSKAKYTCIYRFDRSIASSSNRRAKISPSKKAIMLQSNILNLINGTETLKNQIKLNEI